MQNKKEKKQNKYVGTCLHWNCENFSIALIKNENIKKEFAKMKMHTNCACLIIYSPYGKSIHFVFEFPFILIQFGMIWER